MNVARHLKPSLFVLAGLAAAASPLQATAAPVYLLLEGVITNNVRQGSCSPGCVSSPDTGKTIKIQATWDDRKIFGTDANAAANAGRFRSRGLIGEDWEFTAWVNPVTGERVPFTDPHPDDWYPEGSPYNGIHYYPDAGGHTWDNPVGHRWIDLISWLNYTVTIGDSTPVEMQMGGSGTGFSAREWTVELLTEHTATGDRVALAYSTTAAADSTIRFNFNLPDGGLGVLDGQLFGFNWDPSKGGSAGGGTYSNWSHGGMGGYDTNTVAWNRAILTYNANDLTEVPLPASAWMFGAGLLSLVGNRRLRSKK